MDESHKQQVSLVITVRNVPELHTLLPRALMFGLICALAADSREQTIDITMGIISILMIAHGCTASRGLYFIAGISGITALTFSALTKDPKSVVVVFVTSFLVSTYFKMFLRIFRQYRRREKG